MFDCVIDIYTQFYACNELKQHSLSNVRNAMLDGTMDVTKKKQDGAKAMQSKVKLIRSGKENWPSLWELKIFFSSVCGIGTVCGIGPACGTGPVCKLRF